MQKTEFKVRPDGKGVKLGDRFFYRIHEGFKQVMKDPDTKELVLLQSYYGLKPEQIHDTRREILRHFFSKHSGDWTEEEAEELEIQILDNLRSRRACKGIVAPFCYTTEPAEDGCRNVYTVSELPEGFLEKYRRIDEAVLLPEFPLRARVLAALNLSDAVAGIQEYFGELLYSFCPEVVYVHVENGDIRILIEQCLSPASKGKDRYVYGFASEPGKEIPEMPKAAELLNFLEYTTFRLLCMEDPFDGAGTLVQYPCLTKRALEEIHKGEHKFVFSDGGKPLSAYAGQHAWGKWKGIPRYLRRIFERVFAQGTGDQSSRMDLAEWQKQMQKLRDCLVYVNRQFRLCDPEVPNKVPFMVIGEYRIPVWAKKAIYWYHAGVPYDAKTNGIIGGIDAEGFLENHMDSRWVIEMDKKTFTVAPGKKVKLEEGMKLTVTENICIRVMSGEALPASDTDTAVRGLKGAGRG